jgi:hypothetical protein
MNSAIAILFSGKCLVKHSHTCISFSHRLKDKNGGCGPDWMLSMVNLIFVIFLVH